MSPKSLVLVFLFFVSLSAIAQQPTIIPPPPRPENSPTVIQATGGTATEIRPTQAQKRKEMLETLNKELAQLDQLTAELWQAVARDDGNKLSLDVIHKAEQIEKLAKKIRNTYKQAY
jgi:hypothetical protein